MLIEIPERDKKYAPKTNLYVEIVAKDKKSLQEKPYIVICPGGPGANHSHYKDYRCLQDIANLIFFDPRGCGLSDLGEPLTYTMNNYIEDLEIIRQQLQLEHIILLGKSYGAKCALAYTLRYPQFVEKLILSAGSPNADNLITAKENVCKRGTAEQIDLCEKLWQGTFKNNEEVKHFFELMAPFYSYKKRSNQSVNRPSPDYLYNYQVLNQGACDSLRHFDFSEQLHQISCETLILVGEEDWLTDKKFSQDMANKVSKSQLIIFPNADHALEGDVGELYFGAIRQFIYPAKDHKLIDNSFFATKNTHDDEVNSAHELRLLS